MKDINLEIGERETVALVGHTGSGKSTLMQLFNGLEKPTGGKVYYRGQDIFNKDFSLKFLRSKVGLVFQYPEHQLFESTVIKDVQFGPKNLGWKNLDVEMNSFQALQDVGIGEDLLDASPLKLSGGQKRRVALAGVLAMKPEILVLDEPMAALDPLGRKQIFRMLQRIQKERNLTIVFSTHSMEDAAQYADRIVVMHQGKKVLDGDPRGVFQYEKELEQIGLGIPTSAHLIHRLHEIDDTIPLGAITPEEAVDVIEAWLG